MFFEKIGQWVCFIIIPILVSACAPSKLDLALDIQGSPDNSVKPYHAVLGVDEFIDHRPQAASSDAGTWTGFIPGVLWLQFSPEIPDTSTVLC